MLKRLLRRRFFRRALARGRLDRFRAQAWIPVGERHRLVYVPADDDGRCWWVVEWIRDHWDVVDRCVLLTAAECVAAEREAGSSAETVDLGD